MTRSDNPTALQDEVARFEAEVRRLAVEAVRAIVAQEIQHKRAQLAAAQPKATRGAKPAKQADAKHVQTTMFSEAPASPAAEAAPALPTPTAVPSGKRRQWTRESIIDELSGWIISKTMIDAAFLTRHGPPGLVAAARRVFGRFDAALNVASLHVSKLYPDGPPESAAKR